jgi:hypothetical protein
MTLGYLGIFSFPKHENKKTPRSGGTPVEDAHGRE